MVASSTLGFLLAISVVLVESGDLNRQSIIFNENTPDVFYCPQVLHKLGGKPTKTCKNL